jgi:hypothetical protein
MACDESNAKQLEGKHNHTVEDPKGKKLRCGNGNKNQQNVSFLPFVSIAAIQGARVKFQAFFGNLFQLSNHIRIGLVNYSSSV